MNIIARDPENKLLSHFNRNRLDVEALYDTMASTTNIIVRQENGQPLDVEKDKNRAMYVLASNRSPKGLGPEVRKMFELFDYDSSGGAHLRSPAVDDAGPIALLAQQPAGRTLCREVRRSAAENGQAR